MIDCSRCVTTVCRKGDTAHGPESCPMHTDFPDAAMLYADVGVRETARVAAVVEGRGYRRWTRVEEIMEFARRLGYLSLGLAVGQGLEAEAAVLQQVLTANGFSVVSGGGLSAERQVALCNEAKTQLNLLVGLGVGYDAFFIRLSRAPTTCLVARDTVTGHNPVAAIYGADGFFRMALLGHHLGRLPATGLSHLDISPERILAAAADVAHRGEGRWTRLEETMEFARGVGVGRLGIIFCLGLRGEAKTVAETLERNGFEVVSVGCKAGGVPKENVGVCDSEKVRPGNFEPMCNPVAQAVLLNRSGTALNILMGQCVGHDWLSMKHLDGWVTCLVAKDRVLQHNTLGAIYGSSLYFHDALYKDHQPQT